MAGPTGRNGVQFGPPQRGKETGSRPSHDRRCTEDGCTTLLSTYNSSTTCWLHTGPSPRHALHRG